MQQAPVIKGSGLKVPDEGKSDDQPKHVFGSNLESRVVTEESEESPALTFSVQEAPEKEDDIETIRKRKFDAITGEEDEQTVFQGDFKLFAWDLASSNWVEKGRGQLKLNDSLDEEQKSRVIMRVGGTLKIVLNVAIRHSTFRVIASSKTNIRFTDSQTVWAASGSNASQLRDLIDDRLKIAAEQEKETSKKKPKTQEEEEREEREGREGREGREESEESEESEERKEREVREEGEERGEREEREVREEREEEEEESKQSEQ